MRNVPQHARRAMTDFGYHHGWLIVGGDDWQMRATYSLDDFMWLVVADGSALEPAAIDPTWWARDEDKRYHEDEVADGITARLLADLPDDLPVPARRAIRAAALEAYNRGIADARMAVAEFSGSLSDVVLTGEAPEIPELSDEEFLLRESGVAGHA